jgi:integrase
MPKAHFSDLFLRAIKPPASGQIDFWDTSFPGFGCRVSQGGSKTFILNIRNRRRTLGRYGILSLAKAREEARRLLAEKTLGKLQPQSISFASAVELFLDDKSRSKRPATVDRYRRSLAKFTFKGQLADLSHHETSRQIGKIKHPSAYDHAIMDSKVFFNWCKKRHYIQHNPVEGLSQNAKTTRARVLTEDELKAVWTASDGCGTFGAITKLLILTGQRRGEIAALQSSWINEHSITFPKEITKNGREHILPVGKWATSIVVPLRADGLLFPARGSISKPFNGWSKSKAALDKASGVSDWTLHDLRRTFATRLADMGIAPHVIERMLNHVSGTISGVAAVYNRARYMNEMRAAIDEWEQRLTTILQPPFA